MAQAKIKTYSEKLLQNKSFKKDFEREHENLVLSEKIVVRLYEDIHWQKQAAARDKTFSAKKALCHREVWG